MDAKRKNIYSNSLKIGLRFLFWPMQKWWLHKFWPCHFLKSSRWKCHKLITASSRYFLHVSAKKQADEPGFSLFCGKPFSFSLSWNLNVVSPIQLNISRAAHWARYNVKCSEKVGKEVDSIYKMFILNHHLSILRWFNTPFYFFTPK